jgi:hypothetical protein
MINLIKIKLWKHNGIIKLFNKYLIKFIILNQLSDFFLLS